MVSQFHGDDIAMSWFLVVAPVANTTAAVAPSSRAGAGGGGGGGDGDGDDDDAAPAPLYKLIVWGTGAQHAPLLFDLDADPA